VIYDLIGDKEPIRQGDIFYPLPYTVLSLDKIQTLRKIDETKLVTEASNWRNLQSRDDVIVASVGLKKTWGIVATQNCDAPKSPFVSLFQIEPFEDVFKMGSPKSHKSWKNAITTQCRLKSNMFYLPPEVKIGIDRRMAVNFHKVFQIQGADLNENLSLRRGRLNKTSYEHYRECIAQYFRRYPYDEWYSLNKDEFNAYAEDNKCFIKPFDYQKEIRL
jgi:hypothetical protein